MRGYPQGSAWSIASHLDHHPGTTNAAMFSRPLVNGLQPEHGETRYVFMQTLSKSDGWKYRGKSFMLINQSTIGQAEHIGLFFEAANGTEFVSSGADGNVTNTCLPAAVCVRFTGRGVSHADGRQLQRVGLQPQVRVAPTIAGVRAGKDEVLEAAVRYARQTVGLPRRPAP